MTSSPARQEDYFLLRAEWLRFKSHVFDSNTELPNLAAAMDDVRRLLEERGTLGLVYLDLAGDAQIEMLHGWQAYDEVLRAFAVALAGLKQDGHLGPRDITAVLSVRSDKFLLFLGGAGGPALDRSSVGALSARLLDRLCETLPRHLPPAIAPPFGFQHGYALLYRDPALRAERAIHRALDEAMYMSLRQKNRQDDRLARELDSLIEGQQIVTHYQPILDLRSLRVLGHEVFSHGPPGGPFEDPERLFAVAERAGRMVGLERICRKRALHTVRHHLSRGTKLFLNTSALALRDSDVAGPGLLREMEAQGLERPDVVLEIAERVAVEERQAYRETLRSLKGQGFGIAIDDMGAGYSSLQSIVEIEPDYLKFDISLVRNIDRSLIKRSLLETLVELSGKIGAEVIAEGIEVESEFTTLRDMGVHLGQGRYLAPPRMVPDDLPAAP